MLFIVVGLNGPSPVGLVYGLLHGVGHAVCVHYDVAARVASRPSDGLDHGSLGSQVALFVGVQDSHQTHFRQVKTFPKQVDTHDNVIDAHPKVPQYFDSV